MSVFFIATSTIKDPEKFQEYAGKAGKTVALFGGKLISKGKAEKTMAGEGNHQIASVIGFPNMKALDSWYASEDYQALIPLRNAAANMTIVAYSAPS